MASRRRPMTGTSRSRSRSQNSARILSAILPGTIRRRSCSSHPCWRSFPIQLAFIGWAVVSFLPFLVVMRAIVGRPFGYLLALAIPMVFINALVGQNGFLTAALIGGTLYLIPIRPVLAGICLGLLTLQAAIRAAVSDRADRGRALARVRQRRRHRGRAGVRFLARLRHRELAGLLPLDAEILAGVPDRRPGPMVEDAEHLLAGALFRRQRTARLGIPVGSHRLRCRGAGADLAKPRALYA